MEELKPEKGEKEEMKKDFEKIARENLGKFKEAMDSQDSEKMLNFFAESFVFLPTRWNKIVTQLRGMEEGVYSAEKYFSEFFKLFPKITVNDFCVVPMSNDSYLVTALDNFELTDKNGQQNIGDYKFDQIWKLENDKWKLIHFLSAVSIDGH